MMEASDGASSKTAMCARSSSFSGLVRKKLKLPAVSDAWR